MSDRSSESDFVPPYQGEPGDAAQLHTYLKDVVERCRDPRNWVSSEEWEELMSQIGAALSEFGEMPLVKNDPVIQRHFQGLIFARDFSEFLGAHDRLLAQVASTLAQVDAKRNTMRTRASQKSSSKTRTRLAL